MVFPGAGNWASMMALMNGCTKAGDRALRLSTSSNTYNTCTLKQALNWISFVRNVITEDQWERFTLENKLKQPR